MPDDRVCEMKSGAVCLAASVARLGLLTVFSRVAPRGRFAGAPLPAKAGEGSASPSLRAPPAVTCELARDGDLDDRAWLAAGLECLPAFV